MNYDVHILAVVRVRVVGIEAESQVDAIKKTDAATDLYSLFGNDIPSPRGSTYPISTEYAEDILEYMVDERGDDDYARSRRYTPDPKTGEPTSIDVY